MARIGCSTMWTVLILGIVFSLVDVFYLVWLVESQEWSSVSHPKQENTTNYYDRKPEAAAAALSYKETSKQQIFEILRRAGIDPFEDLDNTTIAALPTWDEVVKMYGEKPVIHGLDQCDRFQNRTLGLGFVSTAGTFNSGTNLMAELLIANCHMQKRMDKFGAKNRGVRWQVPWGKHTPPGDESFRKSHKTSHDASVDADSILPAVTIRDPLTWLTSMCKHHYTARWSTPNEDRCPDFSVPDLKANVRYSDFHRKHESILHLWNDYYLEYLEVPFPRLIVRFEDLIFHPEEVTTTVCHCAGGSMRKDGRFIYILDSAKKGASAHGKQRTGFVEALLKYGSEKNRYASFSFPSDLQYIKDRVDSNLMHIMHYPFPDPMKARPISSQA